MMLSSATLIARRGAQRSLTTTALRSLSSTPATAPTRKEPSAKALQIAKLDDEYLNNEAI